MDGNTAHRVFISYSHADRAFVDALVSELTAKDVNVWLDRKELKVGDSIVARIRDAIHTSRYLIAIISSHSVDSRWVTSELDVATNLQLQEKEIEVLPVLIEDVERLPAFLTGKLYADFRNWTDREVFAAAFLKLLDAIYAPKEKLKYLLEKGEPSRIAQFFHSVPGYFDLLVNSFHGQIYQLREAVDISTEMVGVTAFLITSELFNYGECERSIVALGDPKGKLFGESGDYSKEVDGVLRSIEAYRKTNSFLRHGRERYDKVASELMLVRSRRDVVLIGRRDGEFIADKKKLKNGALYEYDDYSVIPSSYDVLLET